MPEYAPLFSRKEKIVAGVVLCGIAALILWLGWQILNDPIRPWTCSRIQTGMTEEDVDEMLGGPTENKFPAGILHASLQPVPGAEPKWEKLWVGEVWLVYVRFDGQGRVCGKEYSQRNLNNPGPPTFFGQLRQAGGW